MIEKNKYDELLEKYWDVSSWAIWKAPGYTPKSNMEDVSMFSDAKILEQLNSNFVFVGLNGSGRHDGHMSTDKPWHNFHSDLPAGQDYKLRYALMNTPYWGGYITDFIKHFPEVDSVKVTQYVNNHEEVLMENVNLLRDELSILGGKPVLVALGGESYKLLKKTLNKEYVIKKIPHYASYISKENYREQVLAELGN